MKKRPRIALAQIRYFDTPEKHNVAKIKEYISLAKKKNADIVCFPETCIHKTDYLSFNHGLIQEIKISCKENSIWAIVTDSFLVGKQPYKIALLIDRKGKIRGRYKKINLYDDETKAGKRIFTYKTDFGKIGIVICWDLAHPELFKRMKEAGAEVVFCPSKWAYEDKAYDRDHNSQEKELLKAMIKARAFENLFFVALVNPVIKTKDHDDLVSYSVIAGPHKTIKEIDAKEGLITSEINVEEIKRLTRIYTNH